MINFYPGEVVYHPGLAVKMTVSSIDKDGLVSTVWFDDLIQLHREKFIPEVLTSQIPLDESIQILKD